LGINWLFTPLPIHFQLNLNTNTECVNSLLPPSFKQWACVDDSTLTNNTIYLFILCRQIPTFKTLIIMTELLCDKFESLFCIAYASRRPSKLFLFPREYFSPASATLCSILHLRCFFTARKYLLSKKYLLKKRIFKKKRFFKKNVSFNKSTLKKSLFKKSIS